MCMCVCMYVCMCMCVCVCLCESSETTANSVYMCVLVVMEQMLPISHQCFDCNCSVLCLHTIYSACMPMTCERTRGRSGAREAKSARPHLANSKRWKNAAGYLTKSITCLHELGLIRNKSEGYGERGC